MERWDENKTPSEIESNSAFEENAYDDLTVQQDKYVSPTAEGTLQVDSTSNAIDFETGILQALPSTTPEVVRGKSIAKWGIERRTISRELNHLWEETKPNIK